MPSTDSEQGNCVTSVAFARDGKLVATGYKDGGMRLFRTESPEPLQVWGLSGSVTSIVFAPDGKGIAARCADNTIRLLSIESSEPLQVWENSDNSSDSVTSVVFCPDGKTIAAKCGEKLQFFSAERSELSQTWDHDSCFRSVRIACIAHLLLIFQCRLGSNELFSWGV